MGNHRRGDQSPKRAATGFEGSKEPENTSDWSRAEKASEDAVVGSKASTDQGSGSQKEEKSKTVNNSTGCPLDNRHAAPLVRLMRRLIDSFRTIYADRIKAFFSRTFAPLVALGKQLIGPLSVIFQILNALHFLIFRVNTDFH